jgi:hypothetical protein
MIYKGDGWKKGCNLLFNPKGTYLFAPHAGVDCCLLFPGIGTVRPTLLSLRSFPQSSSFSFFALCRPN